ncbi:MAG TPA: hypothetical protein VGC15_21135 [Acetobacteraceae bacterium]
MELSEHDIMEPASLEDSSEAGSGVPSCSLAGCAGGSRLVVWPGHVISNSMMSMGWGAAPPSPA